MRRLAIELDDEIHAKIKIKAIEKHMSLKEVFTKLIEKWLKEK